MGARLGRMGGVGVCLAGIASRRRTWSAVCNWRPAQLGNWFVRPPLPPHGDGTTMDSATRPLPGGSSGPTHQSLLPAGRPDVAALSECLLPRWPTTRSGAGMYGHVAARTGLRIYREFRYCLMMLYNDPRSECMKSEADLILYRTR